MTQAISTAVFLLVLVGSIVLHVRRTHRSERSARAAADQGKDHPHGPRAQHPHIDIGRCIGCGTCVSACPEGDVLGVIAGKAAIINGHKCIGHGMCAEACPVGAITIVLSPPGVGADLPALTAEYESNVKGLFIVGELGGLALIKNAVSQGSAVIDTIARRLHGKPGRGAGEVLDVCIVGAGPGGISASLRAIERKLSYVTLEQDEFGGTVAKFPRKKLVMTSPVEFPLYGKFRKLDLSKEELLRFWNKVSERADLKVRTREKVEGVVRGEDGLFTVRTNKGAHPARFVVLALGRRGTPRKLGVPGEDLPKVMYSLIDAEAWTDARILIVGGGDSAIEAALGLAAQKGNGVTLSYRRSEFSRLKDRNATRIKEAMRKGTVKVLFSSNPVEIRREAVMMEIAGARREIPNDHVWIFAGGIPPNDFLKQCGVTVGEKDLTLEAHAEAKRKGVAA